MAHILIDLHDGSLSVPIQQLVRPFLMAAVIPMGVTGNGQTPGNSPQLRPCTLFGVTPGGTRRQAPVLLKALSGKMCGPDVI